MAQFISDRRDIDFLLHEMLDTAGLAKKSEKFAEFNKKTIDLIVSEARNLAVKEILPTQKEGDEHGCVLENGKVTTPPSFKRLYDLFNEGEWLAMTEDPEWGGQGMPRTISSATMEYFNGANYPFMMYPGLTHGAGKLVEEFGTDEQKRVFLKKMYSGEWAGTMLLTEPGAGSDVGALTTTAKRNDDGTFSITGEKIFISGGEHDLTENIIHPVLARIEGAPEGTKGISLFLVPKFLVNEDGSLGEFNDVVCTGIEHKLGIHGNSTCSLALGSNGKCVGTLLGEENKGMKAMFVMMNEARLLVGFQGFACATASYMYAVNYAKQRIQGKNLLEMMDANAKAVPIIQHPDVRRQLLKMKALVEGMRSILYYVNYCADMAAIGKDEAERAKYQGLVEVLTPIAKGYVTDRAFEVCSQGMQIYGGYGFIEEYPMAQLLRDCRITMIYEGTNGIQAMDLLGRKLGMNKGKPIMDLFGEMQKTVAGAKEIPAIQAYAEKIEKALNKLGEVAMTMGQTAMSPKVLNAFANAHPFQDAAGDVAVAWMLLWRASISATKLEKAKAKDKPFYNGQIKSLQFFVETLLPMTMGNLAGLKTVSGAAVDIDEASFAG
ncbi:Acd17 [Desulforapulum autotrophicum HRM2]|uniref:3-methylmercaptopropionyl-CoA dehydrogenase n=1 Tax=Desulforapulum autotrophicum (strain ATCC 43914 / DSM 3382 / VKM B-1955 / HRM2) TaxID=177437 RepID=C0QIM3_DESAH|nr:acyl-CoA dehydrogenase [Desulforapulum autotrophicum]ACN17967.1 Acd17 [Desulforapulum autotrophicum HRM2]